MIFSAEYPGPRRITLRGGPDSTMTTVKFFTANSVRDGSTTRQRSRGIISGTYPIETLRIERGNLNGEAYRQAVKSACVEISKRRRCTVWDESGWGLAAEEVAPFNDRISWPE